LNNLLPIDFKKINKTLQITTSTLKSYPSFILGKCKCNCGEDIPIRTTYGTLSKYKHGHNRLDYFKTTIFNGEDHYNWKGGRYKDKRTGYVYLYTPNHPFKNKDNKVAEHRLVYEEYYKCCLLPFTQLHHVNKQRDDNRIENLIPTYNGIHRTKYHRLDTSGRFCLLCNSKKTYYRKKRNSYDWHSYKNGHICRKCWRKMNYVTTH
jgi:hypothetical protein